MSAFPKVYTSFAEFKRDELRRLDTLSTSVEDMLEERFTEELNFDEPVLAARRKRGRPRKEF